MKFTQILFPLAFLGSALASPAEVLDKRATTICGSWDTVVIGSYTVYQNLWGRDKATSGSQCTTVTSESGGTLVWSTSWTWAGGQYNVKSYANAAVKLTKKKVSAYTSIPTTWKWGYTGNNIVGNVAYDLFTSSTTTGSYQYEVMVWLAAIGGAGPISSSGSAIATVTISGVSWKLYKGPNGSMTVYSFVASSQQTNFSGDLLLFIKYLINSWGFPSSQYLLAVGAGTEPFTGSNAVLKTSAFKVVVN